MRVLNQLELANTRRKLAQLERLKSAREQEVGGDEELREMTVQSLKRLINQLKEEIARSAANEIAQR